MLSAIQNLRYEIRDFIQHPRRLGLLLSDTPNWNMLASSFDTIADTEHAIAAYEALPLEQHTGVLYVLIYGVLQALYVQQDAVESMVRAFEPNAQRRYRIEDESEAVEIRRIRNRAIGHPTKEGDATRSRTGEQSSFHIVQHSMSLHGFTLMSSFSDGRHTFTEVSIPDLIKKNRTMVEGVLRRIKTQLEGVEMEHREQFKNEKLAGIFPEALDYYFEKIFAGSDSVTSMDGQWGKKHLEMVADKVREFRMALDKRGLLSRTSDYEYVLSEVEYPIAELQQYFEGAGSLRDSRAANIFGYFIHDRVSRLVELAAQLDEEYDERITPSPESDGTQATP